MNTPAKGSIGRPLTAETLTTATAPPVSQKALPDFRPRPRQPHLTVTGQVVFQAEGGEPAVSEFGHGLTVATREEVWRRRQDVTYEWTPLERGWVERALLLELRNLGPDMIEAAVTDEGGRPVPFARLTPGLPLLLEPPDAARLRVRCPKGSARCRVFLVPAADEGS